MAKTKTVKKKTPSTLGFEAALETLETIVSQLEDGQLPLAESLERYEQGVAHLKTCYQILEKAERRIELLRGVDADGKPIVEPLADDGETTLDEKASSRSRRRSRPSHGNTGRGNRGKTDVDERGRLF